ncbi:MAG: hypothetical protein EON60_05560 [Alphaproteobacteria bacterium]|nr:MAG: hypothetical protein EON60_05560 [Alphaproteobacteria bacterium]
MAIRQTVIRKHGFFGTTGRILIEYILTPAIFFALTYALLYAGLVFQWPLWLIALGTLFLGALCYRSIAGIHQQFFTRS